MVDRLAVWYFWSNWVREVYGGGSAVGCKHLSLYFLFGEQGVVVAPEGIAVVVELLVGL